jgi:tRNA(fMet)-specific endonuclease VapC
MKYMLDTNICIYIIKKKPEDVFTSFSKFKPGDICISSITLAELEYGVSKSMYKMRNKIALTGFLAPLSILPFSENAARVFGEIRAGLEREGRVIGGYDMLIAAHALSEGLILVTNNISEFERISQLLVENWVQ